MDFLQQQPPFSPNPTEAARGATTAGAALLSKATAATARGAAADLAESGAPPRGGERLERRETPPAGKPQYI